VYAGQLSLVDFLWAYHMTLEMADLVAASTSLSRAKRNERGNVPVHFYFYIFDVSFTAASFLAFCISRVGPPLTFSPSWPSFCKRSITASSP